MASPEPRAKDYLVELKKIDPGSIERAQLFGGGFDDEDDDDSDVEREEADMVEPQSQSNVEVESAAAINFVSTGTVGDDPDPFAELDHGLKTETGPMQSSLQSRHTSFKVPLGSGLAGAPSSVATLLATAIPAEPASGEVNSLSADQVDPSAVAVSPVAVATETASTIPPVAAATPVTPVAAVPYLTLKIILIPFVCSVALFFLLWSVVNGSFQRLIF